MQKMRWFLRSIMTIIAITLLALVPYFAAICFGLEYPEKSITWITGFIIICLPFFIVAVGALLLKGALIFSDWIYKNIEKQFKQEKED